ncbi:MAG TPA: hypothetical protein VJ949_07350 [Cryomorphaceae bacterium]|nr:hypothetical protein [Cryomorphaceae bacterium]
MKRLFILTLLISLSATLFATTWDEPWQKEIITESEYMVFGSVVFSGDSAIEVTVSKSFGAPLSGTIRIDGFFMLDLCSRSGGHGPEMHFDAGEEGYFFLKKGKNGNYKIPTPTSGFDQIVDGKVHGTFRHTYHQAAVSVEVYELAYEVIWNKYHNLDYDDAGLMAFIDQNLSRNPAGFEEYEIDLFFEQHVALESAYLLGKELDFDTLERFATSDNDHATISALRAMELENSGASKEFLLSFIKDDANNGFNQTIAIWALWNMNDPSYQNKLWKLKDKLSTEENGFGGNIMDPRVCTYLPSPQRAIIDLKEGRN